MNKKRSGLGQLFLQMGISLMGGALFGVVAGIIFQLVFLQDKVTSFGVTGWVIGGANMGLLAWLIVALIRTNRGKYQTPHPDSEAPQLEITRGGFKEGRIFVPVVRDRQSRRSVKRVPKIRKDGRSGAQLLVLLLVLGVGLIVGAYFGWAELASVFGQFNLVIYGTVAATVILVIIITILEQKA